MLCPVCKTALVISERQGIEIDYCPQCRGVWLDRSELDRIIERSVTAIAPPQQPQQREPREYRQDNDRYQHDDKYRHSGHDKHYRKKSLLSELFDF